MEFQAACRIRLGCASVFGIPNDTNLVTESGSFPFYTRGLTLTALPLNTAARRSMAGSWVPAKGSVVWTDSAGTTGYDFYPKAPRPGGLLISKHGGGYKVILVSDDGSRYPTVTKMDGTRLDVNFGPGVHPCRCSRLLPEANRA